MFLMGDSIMSLLESILVYLIYLYIIVLPLAPSKFKIKETVPLNGDIIILFIILTYIINLLVNKRSRERFIKGIKDFFKDKFSISVFIWIAIMLISIIYAKDKRLALSESVRFFTYVILFFIIKYEVHSKNILNRILNIVTLSLFLVDLIGVFEYLKGMGTIQSSGASSFLRIASTLENSNNLGALCVLLIFPYIMLCIKEKNKKKRIIYGTVSFLTFLNIMLSFSRNAWIGLFLGALVFVVTYNLKLIWGVGALGGISLLFPQIRNRVKDIGNISQNLSRITLWQVAFLMIKDHPILGVGAGNYRTYYDQYINKVKFLGYGAYSKFHPHNIYIKAQVELGIIGLVALISYLIILVFNVAKFYNEVENYHYKYFYKGFLSSLIAFTAMNFIDNFFSAPKVISFFWIIIAVASSYKYNSQNI